MLVFAYICNSHVHHNFGDAATNAAPSSEPERKWRKWAEFSFFVP